MIAAHLLEADESDIVIENGQVKVAGTDKALGWHEVALNAYVRRTTCRRAWSRASRRQAFFDPANFSFPAGCHICEVEVDPETGKVEIVQFVAADDFGNIINPMIVEGQVHGGIAQGIGQALLEAAVYDDGDRPASDRELHGLHHAARRRSAVLPRSPIPSRRRP